MSASPPPPNIDEQQRVSSLKALRNSKRTAALVMVQAKFRGIRARRQLALAQSSVDACVRMGDLMKNDAAHNVHAHGPARVVE